MARLVYARATAGRNGTSLLPDLLPPVAVVDRRPGSGALLFADLVDVPAGQAGQRLRLALAAGRQIPAVVRGRRAGLAARPGVPQHVPALEVAPVAGLLEHEVLGEVGAVVADVQARHEDVAPARHRPTHAGPSLREGRRRPFVRLEP